MLKYQIKNKNIIRRIFKFVIFRELLKKIVQINQMVIIFRLNFQDFIILLLIKNRDFNYLKQ